MTCRAATDLSKCWHALQLVGTHGIAGKSYVKTYPKRPSRELGVWPSDHFGIFAEFDRQQSP